jgi:hypothetical protein
MFLRCTCFLNGFLRTLLQKVGKTPRSPSNECFKLVEEVVNDYVPEIVSSLKSKPVAGETLKEICNLLVDITEIANMEIPRNYSAEEVMRFCIPSTLITIVRPAVDHLFTAYVFGAYPLCYQPIRISVEAIAYSLSVDIKKPLKTGNIYPEKVSEFQKCLDEIGDGDFLEKLLRLQNCMDEIQFRPSRLIDDWLPEIVGEELAKRLMGVWSKTSNDFLHFKGYSHKAGSEKWDSSNPPPSYMIGAFVEYDTSDEPFLEELKNTIKEFRGLLKEVWSYWKYWYDTQRQKSSESENIVER